MTLWKKQIYRDIFSYQRFPGAEVKGRVDFEGAQGHSGGQCIVSYLNCGGNDITELLPKFTDLSLGTVAYICNRSILGG